MRLLPAVFVAFVGLFLSAVTSHAFLDFFKKDLDKVPESAEMRAQEAAANAKVTEALDLETAGKHDKAFDIYKGVVRKYPLTTSAAMSQYKIGAIQKSRGDYVKAFESFQNFVDDYKQSSAFDAAVASQFEIAKASETGEHKEKFIGISRKVQRSEVLQMYQSIIKNAPYSEFAPQAQYAIGDVLEKDDKGPEAIAAFKKVVASYPKSALAADAQFRIGEIGAQAIKDGSRNIANVDSSRRAYEDLLLGYNDDARAAEAKSRVVQFDELEAQKAFEVGQFYEKQKNYKSAALYYRRVAQSSGTSAAAAAQERLAIVEAKIPSGSASVEPRPAAVSSPVGSAAERIKKAIPRPRLGSRIFGRKKRAEREAEEAATAAESQQATAAAEAAAKKPSVTTTPAPKPPGIPSKTEVANVAPGATKLTQRKGYHGPPAPNLALGKKENKMRLDPDSLGSLPFDIGKMDKSTLEKGLKQISKNLPDELPDDLSGLVIPPPVTDTPPASDAPEVPKKEAGEKEAVEKASGEGDEVEEGKQQESLKIPPPPEDDGE